MASVMPQPETPPAEPAAPPDTNIVAALCPAFAFHPQEKRRPCSLEEMAARATDPARRPVVYYAHDEREHSVTYVTAYVRDDGPVVLRFPRCCHVGGHAWDVEFVRVYYDAATSAPLRAYFSAHASDQGTWVELAGDRRRDERLTAHVSLGSHALYPTPGVKWRIFGFANDLCAPARGDRANVLDPVAERGALAPMPAPASLDAAAWDGFMQWSYATEALKGAPRDGRGAFWFRLAYPLSRRR